MPRRTSFHAAVAGLLLLAAGGAGAEVVDATAAGFTVKSVIEVKARPAAVWTALVEGIGVWWEASHTFSGDAANLSLDPRPQGCFCETLPDGGGVRHLTVVYAAPGKVLRLTGGLGPLQAAAIVGTMTWTLEELDAELGPRTEVTLAYQAGGYLEGGLAGWAAGVDRVVGEQLFRLGRYVETGSPEKAAEGG